MPLLLNIFGQLEQFVADDLYPHRYIVTPVLVGLALLALFIAYRLGAHVLLLRNRVATVVIGVPLVAICLLAGNYFLSPLWERSTLNEASPLEAAGLPSANNSNPAGADGSPVNEPGGAPATPAAGSASTLPGDQPGGPAGSATLPGAPTDPDDPAVSGLASDSVDSLSREPAVTHAGSFVGADDFHFGRGDALVIRTEDDQHVLRFENFSVRNGPDLFVYLSSDPTGETVEEAYNLGELKATDGAFNYEIPATIDLDEIASVVVWCRQFSVLFAVADLS